MSVNDPIADMLTRIRNGVMSSQTVVAMPNSKIKTEIARILKEEGFIEDYEVAEGAKPSHKVIRIKLKYVGERRDKRPVISGVDKNQPPRPPCLHTKERNPLGIIRYGYFNFVNT